MTKLTLFQFEHCPYCEKVRKKLEEKKVHYHKFNVPQDRDDPIRKELFQKSGAPTVPVLKADEKYIGESEKILKYLEENF